MQIRFSRDRDGLPPTPAGLRPARARSTPGTGHYGQEHGGARLPAGAGIEVTLLWHRTNGKLTVSVTDAASGVSFELPVAPDQALRAFHHPYAYAAAQGVAY